jgi:hypothetical protein
MYNQPRKNLRCVLTLHVSYIMPVVSILRQVLWWFVICRKVKFGGEMCFGWHYIL